MSSHQTSPTEAWWLTDLVSFLSPRSLHSTVHGFAARPNLGVPEVKHAFEDVSTLAVRLSTLPFETII